MDFPVVPVDLLLDGKNGSGFPTVCGGIVTPKSVREINAGLEKMLLSSLMVCKFWSVRSKLCESAVLVASVEVKAGVDEPEKYAKYTYPRSNTATIPPIAILFCFKKFIWVVDLMEPIRADNKSVVGSGAA